jgi:hypothetical protein
LSDLSGTRKEEVMTRVLLETAELNRIEELVREFDPARHPSCAPMLDNASGEDLNAFRAYVAHSIRARLGLELLARAASETAAAEGWADAVDTRSFVDGALGSQAHGSAYSAMVLRRRFGANDISVGAYELVLAARNAMFATPDVEVTAGSEYPVAADVVIARQALSEVTTSPP